MDARVGMLDWANAMLAAVPQAVVWELVGFYSSYSVLPQKYPGAPFGLGADYGTSF